MWASSRSTKPCSKRSNYCGHSRKQQWQFQWRIWASHPTTVEGAVAVHVQQGSRTRVDISELLDSAIALAREVSVAKRRFAQKFYNLAKTVCSVAVDIFCFSSAWSPSDGRAQRIRFVWFWSGFVFSGFRVFIFILNVHCALPAGLAKMMFFCKLQDRICQNGDLIRFRAKNIALV